MANKINTQQTCKQVDKNLKAIIDVLKNAPDSDGTILYIRNSQLSCEDGKTLLSITQLE